MWIAACALFILHSLGMLADEARFHRRRGLPRWERWGHPLDTLSVLACYLLALTGNRGNLPVYIAAAAFSTLFVTKDEWIHAGACTGGEMWLHAVLFALHPVLLGLAGIYMLGAAEGSAAMGPGISGAVATAFDACRAIGSASGRAGFGAFLAVQAGLTALFLGYQLLYWNGPWKPALPSEA